MILVEEDSSLSESDEFLHGFNCVGSLEDDESGFEDLEPPPSTGLVTVAFTMLGVMALFPWNCVLSSTDFFMELFPDYDWPLYSTQVYQTTFMLVQVVMIVCGANLNIWLQLVVPLLVCCCSTSAVMLVATKLESGQHRFVITLIVLAVLSTSMAVMQSSLFGVAAKGIEQYGPLPASLITGMGIAGVISMSLALSCSFLFTSPEVGFLVLFGAIVVLALLSLFWFKVFRGVQSSQAVSYTRMTTSSDARLASTQGPLDAKTDEVWSSWRSARAGLVYELAIFCTFAVTFMIFPAVAAKWRGSGIIPSTSYVTFVMGDFQIMDTVGRVAAERIPIAQKLGAPVPLWILVLARGSFVPLFILCVNGYGIFIRQYLQLIVMALMSFSNGFVASLTTQCAPLSVPAPARGTVGMVMTLAMVAGIAAGSYLAMAMG